MINETINLCKLLKKMNKSSIQIKKKNNKEIIGKTEKFIIADIRYSKKNKQLLNYHKQIGDLKYMHINDNCSCLFNNKNIINAKIPCFENLNINCIILDLTDYNLGLEIFKEDLQESHKYYIQTFKKISITKFKELDIICYITYLNYLKKTFKKKKLTAKALKNYLKKPLNQIFDEESLWFVLDSNLSYIRYTSIKDTNINIFPLINLHKKYINYLLCNNLPIFTPIIPNIQFIVGNKQTYFDLINTKYKHYFTMNFFINSKKSSKKNHTNIKENIKKITP